MIGKDLAYQKLLDQVKAGELCKYWIEDGILYAKGSRAFIPNGSLRNELLRETHDFQWAGHPSVDGFID